MNFFPQDLVTATQMDKERNQVDSIWNCESKNTCGKKIAKVCSVFLRGDWIPQNGCFFGKLPKGGGSFPIQNITLQILLVSKRYILEKKKAQCNFQKRGGGGQRPFGSFPKNIHFGESSHP